MSSIFEQMRAQMGEQPEPPRILPEAAIATLREALACYGRSITTCPYPIGALVTPQPWSVYAGKEAPAIVLKVGTPLFQPCEESEISQHGMGDAPDMLVATFQFHGAWGYHVVSTHWVSSWQYMPWVGEPESKHAS